MRYTWKSNRGYASVGLGELAQWRLNRLKRRLAFAFAMSVRYKEARKEFAAARTDPWPS